MLSDVLLQSLTSNAPLAVLVFVLGWRLDRRLLKIELHLFGPSSKKENCK